jgi:hypothetical protein
METADKVRDLKPLSPLLSGKSPKLLAFIQLYLIDLISGVSLADESSRYAPGRRKYWIDGLPLASYSARGAWGISLAQGPGVTGGFRIVYIRRAGLARTLDNGVARTW